MPRPCGRLPICRTFVNGSRLERALKTRVTIQDWNKQDLVLKDIYDRMIGPTFENTTVSDAKESEQKKLYSLMQFASLFYNFDAASTSAAAFDAVDMLTDGSLNAVAQRIIMTRGGDKKQIPKPMEADTGNLIYKMWDLINCFVTEYGNSAEYVKWDPASTSGQQPNYAALTGYVLHTPGCKYASGVFDEHDKYLALALEDATALKTFIDTVIPADTEHSSDATPTLAHWDMLDMAHDPYYYQLYQDYKANEGKATPRNTSVDPADSIFIKKRDARTVLKGYYDYQSDFSKDPGYTEQRGRPTKYYDQPSSLPEEPYVPGWKRMDEANPEFEKEFFDEFYDTGDTYRIDPYMCKEENGEDDCFNTFRWRNDSFESNCSSFANDEWAPCFEEETSEKEQKLLDDGEIFRMCRLENHPCVDAATSYNASITVTEQMPIYNTTTWISQIDTSNGLQVAYLQTGTCKQKYDLNCIKRLRSQKKVYV